MLKKLICIIMLLFTIAPLFEAEAVDYLWAWPTSGTRGVYNTGKPYHAIGHPAIDINGTRGVTNIISVTTGTVTARFTGCKNINGLANGLPCEIAGKGCAMNNLHDYADDNSSKKYCNYGVGNGLHVLTDDGYVLQYAHMDSISSNISVNSKISKGQVLGKMGSSGVSTGTHLHFEVRYNNHSNHWNKTPINPLTMLNRTEGTDNEISVSFTQPTDTSYANKAAIGNTTATVVTKINKTPGSIVSEGGLNLYSSSGTLLKQTRHAISNVSNNGSYFHSWYEIGSGKEVSYTLSPGTKYLYRYYVKINGKEYLSSAYSFTTTGTASASTVTFTTPTDSSYANKVAIGNTTATMVTKINKPAGSEVTEAGFHLYSSSGNELANTRDSVSNVSTNGTYFHSWYEIGAGKEINYALLPGTNYRYRYYVKVDGKRYYSSTYNFTTTGTSPEVVTFSESTDSPYTNMQYIDNSSATFVTRVNKPVGASVDSVRFYIGQTESLENCYDHHISLRNDSPGISDNTNYFHLVYNLGEGHDINYTFFPGREYEYYFTVYVDDVFYRSEIKTFTMPGIDDLRPVEFVVTNAESILDQLYIRDTTALLATVIRKPAFVPYNNYGIKIYDMDSNLVADYIVENPDISVNNYGTTMLFEIGDGKQVDCTLLPGTQYKYHYFARVDGVDYSSYNRRGWDYFTTTGTAPEKPEVSFDVYQYPFEYGSHEIAQPIYNKTSEIESRFYYKPDDAPDSSYTTQVPEAIGDYTVKVVSETHTKIRIGTSDYIIFPKTLTDINTVGLVVTKPYDESSSAGNITGEVEFDGIINSEDVTVAVSPGDYPSEYVGTYTIDLNLTTGGANKNNYLVMSPISFSLASITPIEQAPAITTNLTANIGDSIDLASLVKGAMGDVSFSIAGDKRGSFVDGNSFTAGAPGEIKLNIIISGFDAGGSSAFEYKPYEKAEAITITINPSATAAKEPKSDINNDGVVTIADLYAVAESASYNKSVGQLGYNSDFDVDGNNYVNFNDLVVIRNTENFNRQTG